MTHVQEELILWQYQNLSTNNMILTYNNINIYRTYMAARQRFIPFPGKNYFIQDLYSHNSAPDLMLSSFSSL